MSLRMFFFLWLILFVRNIVVIRVCEWFFLEIKEFFLFEKVSEKFNVNVVFLGC